MVKIFLGVVFTGLSIGYYMKNKKPLGIRNNNPLNMREVGINWNNKTGENRGFTTFKLPFDGIRAAANDMKNKMNNGINTIRKIVSVWAPPTENKTAAYVANVSKKTGLDADQTIENFEQLAAVIEAMIYHENGQQPYDKYLISAAVFDGLTSGQSPPAYFDVINRGDYA
jgi:hypothetical protein